MYLQEKLEQISSNYKRLTRGAVSFGKNLSEILKFILVYSPWDQCKDKIYL